MQLQDIFDNFKKNNKNDRVVIYGAGTYSFRIFALNNLAGINFVGVVDRKYQNKKNNKFFNIPAFSPSELEKTDYDTLFVFMKDPNVISDILEKTKKSGKNIILFNDDKIPFEKNNKIIIVENEKERIATEDELPPDFKLNYTDDSKNNVLKVELPHYMSAVTINFNEVSDCKCEIMSTRNIINKLIIHFGESSNMKIKIGRNISVISGVISTNQTQSEIEIGEDCMLASDVQITGSDAHSIYDRATGKLINIQKNKLQIGNHVWIGDHARVMKNSVIPDGCVVGANSVTAKRYTEQNTVLAGNPAIIVKNNIYWDRSVITDLNKCVDTEEMLNAY